MKRLAVYHKYLNQKWKQILLLSSIKCLEKFHLEIKVIHDGT
jgi:hypothetical protein